MVAVAILFSAAKLDTDPVACNYSGGGANSVRHPNLGRARVDACAADVITNPSSYSLWPGNIVVEGFDENPQAAWNFQTCLGIRRWKYLLRRDAL